MAAVTQTRPPLPADPSPLAAAAPAPGRGAGAARGPDRPARGASRGLLGLVTGFAAAGLLAFAADVREAGIGGFVVEREVLVAATPEQAYDAFTGDVSGWWDHHFSPAPTALRIEAVPGGRFLELFGDGTDGVVHATVTWAERGRKLVFRGPLGAHGRALDLVHTVTFAPAGDATRVAIEVSGTGQADAGNRAAIDLVWHHFLEEQFKPWVEGGGR